MDTQAHRNEFKIGAAIQSKYLLSMKAERVERLTAWGPGAHLRAPGGVQGQSPGGGLGSFWVLAFVKDLERLSWKYFFFFKQPRSGTENVPQLNETTHCVE